MITIELISVLILMTFLSLNSFIFLIELDRKKRNLLKSNEDDKFTEFIRNKKNELGDKRSPLDFNLYLRLAIVFSFVFFITVFLITRNPVVSLLVMPIGIFVPEFIVRKAAKKRKDLYSEKFSRALSAMAGGMNSDLSIKESIDDVCRNELIDKEVREDFEELSNKISMGISVPDAFLQYAEYKNNSDIMDVYAVIYMENEIGGNRGRGVSQIAEKISQRMMLDKEIKTMFAGTNVMIKMVDILPPVMIVFMYVLAPTMFLPYFQSLYMFIVFIGLLVTMAAGSVVIRKLVKSLS